MLCMVYTPSYHACEQGVHAELLSSASLWQCVQVHSLNEVADGHRAAWRDGRGRVLKRRIPETAGRARFGSPSRLAGVYKRVLLSVNMTLCML